MPNHAKSGQPWRVVSGVPSSGSCPTERTTSGFNKNRSQQLGFSKTKGKISSRMFTLEFDRPSVVAIFPGDDRFLRFFRSSSHSTVPWSNPNSKNSRDQTLIRMLCTPRMGRHRSSAVSWSLARRQCGERYSFICHRKTKDSNDWKGLKGYEYEMIWSDMKWLKSYSKALKSWHEMLAHHVLRNGPDHWSGLSQEDEGWRCTHVRQDRCSDATSLFQTSDGPRRASMAKSHRLLC